MQDERAEQHLAARVVGAFLPSRALSAARCASSSARRSSMDLRAIPQISFSGCSPRLSFPAVFSSVCLLRLNFGGFAAQSGPQFHCIDLAAAPHRTAKERSN
jgi:hypothetical protein